MCLPPPRPCIWERDRIRIDVQVVLLSTSRGAVPGQVPDASQGKQGRSFLGCGQAWGAPWESLSPLTRGPPGHLLPPSLCSRAQRHFPEELSCKTTHEP